MSDNNEARQHTDLLTQLRDEIKSQAARIEVDKPIADAARHWHEEAKVRAGESTQAAGVRGSQAWAELVVALMRND